MNAFGRLVSGARISTPITAPEICQRSPSEERGLHHAEAPEHDEQDLEEDEDDLASRGRAVALARNAGTRLRSSMARGRRPRRRPRSLSRALSRANGREPPTTTTRYGSRTITAGGCDRGHERQQDGGADERDREPDEALEREAVAGKMDAPGHERADADHRREVEDVRADEHSDARRVSALRERDEGRGDLGPVRGERPSGARRAPPRTRTACRGGRASLRTAPRRAG